MRHIDLFSGIGGFALAASWVWGKDHEIVSFCEIDPFCQKVLKKHWPDVPIISDIKEYKHDGTDIDLLTGGFPCQPFSVAGKRGGAKDDRFLWPEMLRVISEVHPTWIIGENVSGIINMELEQVCLNLENEGYEVQPFIIPACAVNAPHRRDRVWIVAHTEGGDDRRKSGKVQGEDEQQKKKRQKKWAAEPCCSGKSDAPDPGCFRSKEHEKQAAGSEQYCEDAPDADRFNGDNGRHDSGEISQLKATEICELQNDSDAEHQRLQRGQRPEPHDQRPASHGSTPERNSTWDEPWIEVASRLCRVDDGISRRMDRTNRLKALGNAIVPQVLSPIMQAIKKIEVGVCSK